MQAETKRLVLRPLAEEDYEVWKAGFENAYPQQYKYDGQKLDLSEWTLEAFKEVVKEHEEMMSADQAYILAIFRKSDLQHIGMVGIWTLMRGDFQWGYIEYRLHNPYWKQGYAREAVQKGFTVAFDALGFHRIEAHINVDNDPSIKLAEHVGMQYECRRNAFTYEEGQWRDSFIYVINAPVS
ncbi:GNAT family N-acetyltransferase [Alkalicoccus urumqiensis]|uniref:GNAT family N-acetyltransferase n=1 Tax=Alkalicoccus urumqiensis TaxID=1548213 RepID=A0A2P6ME16_ALKUR|nr:GNAT family N-acetyltransferase [Alkalicoccus urumqiensis]PRO64506.1 GNAT family N-acetyltransferase [Alkalicoccus urumqiensis]